MAKSSLNFFVESFRQYVEGEMFTRTLPTTHLQILSEIIQLNSKATLKVSQTTISREKFKDEWQNKTCPFPSFEVDYLCIDAMIMLTPKAFAYGHGVIW